MVIGKPLLFLSLLLAKFRFSTSSSCPTFTNSLPWITRTYDATRSHLIDMQLDDINNLIVLMWESTYETFFDEDLLFQVTIPFMFTILTYDGEI